MDDAREMTRKEAKRVLEVDLDHTYNDESKEALRMAIKALEQEPCEDAISRQAALNGITMAEVRWQAVDNVKKLPPVIPQPKTGHWIPRQEIIGVDKEGNEMSATVGYKCSKCLIVHPRTSIYCPSCGAKMVEPQGRSE
jgi:hypothetical protein